MNAADYLKAATVRLVEADALLAAASSLLFSVSDTRERDRLSETLDEVTPLVDDVVRTMKRATD